MEEIQYHQWLKSDTTKVKVEKGQRGTYAWEITYEGEDISQVVGKIKEADTILMTRLNKRGQ